ncbi:phage N-6-adenine-methyltransferase [Roseivirga pacifica]|uniref:phage N-6-adenine-methyltransferase n=1 Tax=Roseivirga pacifica TaxID=1267423 RepID=UPI0020957B0D|nr:phage N-6-adenine-methyltransferase [Roseivirga pacifica]MCO6358542.1 adenine methyltransferase [Roseivirga pacifica]MCO6369097.1 adenine methyltransferase [Roseivirga pacifica]MCO6372199.1 adenine methyltransferase [Roseivirga pacifica]MCO6374273.1 adenine methyltransferase [Roseivirga pacifica]MCO6380930.1 adenine methyltransferase [Roseivirga pacifica]
MKSHLSTVGKTDTWITPKYITDSLGEFDLDPCAHTEMPWFHAKKSYTIDDDGLSKIWEGRVFLNPPFNRYVIDSWFKKFSEHGNGVMLVSAALETDRFKKYIFGKASGILFMNHRPQFCHPDGQKAKANSGQTMCLVSFGSQNLKALIDSGLGVPFTEIQSLNTKY